MNLGDFRRRNLPTYVYEESVFIEEDPVDVYVDSSPLSRAYAAFAKGSFYESVIAFNEWIDADPENGVLYLARAQADIAIADYRTAYEDLIRGMELVPEWSWSQNGRKLNSASRSCTRIQIGLKSTANRLLAG